jgi:DNA ligase (NAD+)
MTKSQAQERIKKLKTLIQKYRYQYHVLDKQEVSDAVQDSLKHELLLLENQYPDLVTPDSPTQRVGGEPLKKFHKVTHAVPMLSIEDVFGVQELADWEAHLQRLLPEKSFEYFGEVKIDGFAVSLVYKQGVLVQGSTRGNGTVGEDVTQNLKTIESIPLKLESFEIQNSKFKIPALLEVRGEVYMTKKDFANFNKQREKNGEEQYANPRNLAAGSIRQLDAKLAAQRPLRFMAYDVVGGADLHSTEHELLHALGFVTDSTATVCNNIQEVWKYYNAMAKQRDGLPFEIDGIVCSVNNNVVFSLLGVAGKSPRGMRAIKFAASQATTKVLDIRVQIGRTGAITPVAYVEPVVVKGVTIARATLHNEDEIQRLGVRIGDTVIVERAGDVIPAIVQVLPELRTGKEKVFLMPKKCPVCASSLVKPKGEAVLRCINKKCQAQRRESLYHFVSKKAFNIEGLGPKIIDQLMDSQLVSWAPDLFELKQGDLIPLERFADKSAQNTISAIQNSIKVPLYRFVYSLGIRHIGEETARSMADYFQSIKAIQNASKQDFERIPDIGGVVAESAYAWFQDKSNQKLVLALIGAGVDIMQEKKHIGKKLSGKTFVLTGTLESMTRDQAKEIIRMQGGDIVETVSQKTSFVVAGTNPGSKFTKAKELGIPILSEKEFTRKLKGIYS